MAIKALTHRRHIPVFSLSPITAHWGERGEPPCFVGPRTDVRTSTLVRPPLPKLPSATTIHSRTRMVRAGVISTVNVGFSAWPCPRLPQSPPLPREASHLGLSAHLRKSPTSAQLTCLVQHEAGRHPVRVAHGHRVGAQVPLVRVLEVQLRAAGKQTGRQDSCSSTWLRGRAALPARLTGPRRSPPGTCPRPRSPRRPCTR